jgi:Ca-activated chloride channel homolog
MIVSMRLSVSFLASAILIAAAGAPALGEKTFVASVFQQPQQERALFSIRSELVLLSVTVKDKKNHYLTDLSKEAFTVFDNGLSQPIRFFMTEDAPATIGLLIDNSGSMQPNRELVVAAAKAFAQTSNPQDDIFALVFNEEVRGALTTESPFTNDPEVLRDALQHAVTTRGRTALFDAIVRGMEYVNQGSHDRKVLVIVSDGADNASASRFEHVLHQIQASNVVVYAVGLIDPVERVRNPKHLKALAEATGGEVFQPNNPKQVTEVLQRIARDIRHAYVMAYEPADEVREAGLRRIRVAVQSPDNGKLTVRTRAAYLAGASEPRPNQEEQGDAR